VEVGVYYSFAEVFGEAQFEREFLEGGGSDGPVGVGRVVRRIAVAVRETKMEVVEVLSDGR